MVKTVDEMRAEALAYWRRQWEAEHQQRKEASLATITLVPKADESPVFSEEYQTEFRRVKAALSEGDIEAEAPFMALDAVDAVSGYTGELLIPFAQIILPIVGVALGAWLQSKAGRKIRIKIGDVEVEAPTKETLTVVELEKILKRALTVRTNLTDKEKE